MNESWPESGILVQVGWLPSRKLYQLGDLPPSPWNARIVPSMRVVNLVCNVSEWDNYMSVQVAREDASESLKSVTSWNIVDTLGSRWECGWYFEDFSGTKSLVSCLVAFDYGGVFPIQWHVPEFACLLAFPTHSPKVALISFSDNRNHCIQVHMAELFLPTYICWYFKIQWNIWRMPSIARGSLPCI